MSYSSHHSDPNDSTKENSNSGIGSRVLILSRSPTQHGKYFRHSDTSPFGPTLFHPSQPSYFTLPVLPSYSINNNNSTISLLDNGKTAPASAIAANNFEEIRPLSQLSGLSEDYYIDPRWDDMVTLSQVQKLNYRQSSTATSLLNHSFTTNQELDSLLNTSGPFYHHASSTRFDSFLFRMTNSMLSRYLLLVLFPVFIVSIWCSVPLQVDERVKKPGDEPAYHMNFYFFLFYYYGFYNLTAILMVTQYFNLYSFYWWPKYVSGILATFGCWLFSMGLGLMLYWIPLLTNYELYKYIYTWILLTLLTLLIPLWSAFLIIRADNRNVYRHSLTEAQKVFLILQESRIPSSYRRFLWFCLTLVLSYTALLIGETYARNFTPDLEKSWLDGVIYVYTWVITVFILDFVNDFIIDVKIKSWALSHVYRYYYALLYFIFYRNLFIKLRNPDQFLVVQIISSLWVIFNYPVRMSKITYKVVKWFGSKKTYTEYCKNVGRSFFIRNLAENVSMVGFLFWVNILYFGPNSKVYPYFRQFDPTGEHHNESLYFPLTIKASLIIWGCELLSAWVTRHIFKKYFNHSITREAVIDFYKYPEVIWAMVLVTIHVLQDMLMALIDTTKLT